MEITVTNFGNRAQRLVLVGDLDIFGAEKLDLPLATLAGAGGNLVIDMTRLDGVAAIGIRHLVCAARALRRDSGQLLLLGPNPIVANMLRTARVDDLLPIAGSEDEAREALGSCNRSGVATGQ
jgi:anti-sigma B factor antagonist